jgi:energy-coupling factor transport system permease protein
MALSLYIEGMSSLHRRHPVAKLMAMVTLFAAAFLLDDPAFIAPLTVAVLAATIAAHAYATLWRLRWVVVPVFVFTLVIWTLFYPVPAGGVVARGEALRFGLGMALKLETFLVTGLLFLATTTVEEFAVALRSFGVPYRAGFVITLAFRLVPVFLESALTVVDAQRCRGLDFTRGRLHQRIARYVPVIVPVFISGLRRADQMAFALEVRGFSSGRTRTGLPRAPADVADWLLVVAAGVTLAGYVALWTLGIGRIVPR